MQHPSPDQIAKLTSFEQAAFWLCSQVNHRPLLKRVAHSYLKTIGTGWIHQCTRNLVHVDGLDHVTSLCPDRSVVLVSNHRSFFDFYLITSVLLRSTSWVREMYFPVKSSYFYERPDGVMVNALMSALAMYPPIMRDQRKRSFNQFAVEHLAELAKRNGVVIGLHPEGTRCKSDDPYTLLPAQPGAGQVIHAARPIVLPAFVLGLGNDIVKQVRGNFNGQGEPITLVFGKPLELDNLLRAPGRLRTYKAISDQVRQELMMLGEKERAFRCAMGFPSKEPKTSSTSRARKTTRPSSIEPQRAAANG